MTRGERNNNPGNIDRTTQKWAGMSEPQTDIRFVCFNTSEDGIRALAKVLLTYYRKHNLRSVRNIIDRWAPPKENDTESYATHVATILGVEPDAVINVEDPATLEVLVRAIIRHENGRCIYDDTTILAAIHRALA